MHAVDVLMYGNRTLMMALEKVPEGEWQTNNVCGWWSVKDIIAHLTSYELALTEVLKGFVGESPGEFLREFARPDFNDRQVTKRMEMSPQEVLDEYQQAYEYNMTLARQVPEGKWRETGALPWYGEGYDLEDFIAYAFYGHKREHSAQVNVFTDRFRAGG